MSTTIPSSTDVKVSPAPAIVNLAGKVAIVTGSSRGIGAGVALRLARDGAKVIVNYQKEVKSAEAVVAAIQSIGGSATAIQADVSKSADIDRLFAEAKRIYGRIDIVVANSGIVQMSPFAAETDDAFDHIVNVNLKGAFYTLRAAAKLIENNGRIVVVGSNSKVGVIPGMAAYAATKAAVEVLSSTLAQELGGRGITVNTVHPGATTDMAPKDAPHMLEYVKNMSPFKRIGTVADISDGISLIVSDAARWISGQSIRVDGAAKL